MSSYNQAGDEYGVDWVPPECDVSIRPGWFWHSSEQPKSALTLLDIYYKSVGRNCLLLLNVPPNTTGLISDEDLRVLKEFTALRRRIFSHNFAQDSFITASSTRGGHADSQFSPTNILKEGIYTYWAPDENQTHWEIYITLDWLVSFNMIQIQEPIQMGQRIIEFHVDAVQDRKWVTIVSGTTIGYKRLLQFPEIKTASLRFIIDKSRADPLISYIGIYHDSFSPAHDAYNAPLRSSFNNSEVIELSTSKISGNKSTATV